MVEWDKLFSPGSVAVVGASRDESKVGYAVLRNLRESFKGRIYPVNPKADELEGLKCFKSVSEIPGEVDLAVIVVPSNFVAGVLEECGEKGVQAVVVISAGFKEVGLEGAKLEREILDTIKKYGMSMVGPNCLGVIDTCSGLNASFASRAPLRGSIAFMSQSGALCSAILDWAALENVGFSKFVSLGNKADLCENDFLEVFSDDEETNVILAYLEGLKDGRAFMELMHGVSQNKPVIVLKAGTTRAGIKAAASHTGTLAGSDKAYEAAFRQCGVIRVSSGEELFDFAEAFSTQPLPKGDRVAIITNAGGPGIMAADACEKHELKLALLSQETIDELKSNLPAAASIYNPVDVLGDASHERFDMALTALLRDSGVDGVIVLLTPQAMTDMLEIAESVSSVVKKHGKPVLCSFMGGVDVSEGVDMLQKNGVPNYPYPERAAKTMKAMVKYTRLRDRVYEDPPKFKVSKSRVKEVFAKARSEGRLNLGLESIEVLDAYGIKTSKSKTVGGLEGAKAFAEEIGYPVVLKIVSPDILHKSDVGCVKVNVGREKFESAYNQIMSNALKYMPDANILGMLVQEMVSTGKEVILGMSKDPQLGPLLMFGLGGVYVEVLKDVVFRVAPVNELTAKEMVSEIKSYQLLKGVRGEPPSDIDSVVDTILRLSQLVTDFPEIAELDLNPSKVFKEGEGYSVIDVRIILEDQKGGGVK